MKSIEIELGTIIGNLLSIPNLQIEKTTKLDEIQDWDSLVKIQLVFELEKTFNKKFSAEQIQNWFTIDDIIFDLSKN